MTLVALNSRALGDLERNEEGARLPFSLFANGPPRADHVGTVKSAQNQLFTESMLEIRR